MTINDGGRAVFSVQTDLDSAGTSLHSRMRDLTLKRQNHTNLRQKAKWALYEENAFRRLIEDITELVTSLTELFSDNQVSQKGLCDEEVATIATDEHSKYLLKEIAAEHDPLLEAAISKATNNAASTHNIVFSGSHNAGFQLAHNSGTISGLQFGKTKPVT